MVTCYFVTFANIQHSQKHNYSAPNYRSTEEDKTISKQDTQYTNRGQNNNKVATSVSKSSKAGAYVFLMDKTSSICFPFTHSVAAKRETTN